MVLAALSLVVLFICKSAVKLMVWSEIYNVIGELTHPAPLRLRPSLLRKEGEEKQENSSSLFPRSEERLVERSNDRVSKIWKC